MEIRENWAKCKIEKSDKAVPFQEDFEITIPSDFKEFKSKYGGILIPQGKPPYLLLGRVNPNVAIGEFHKFLTYQEIYNYFEKNKNHSYPEFSFEKEMSILKIGTCEEQIDIYIGYGDKNMGEILIYNWEEDEFINVEDIWVLLSDYLVEYDESLF